MKNFLQDSPEVYLGVFPLIPSEDCAEIPLDIYLWILPVISTAVSEKIPGWIYNVVPGGICYGTTDTIEKWILLGISAGLKHFIEESLKKKIQILRISFLEILECLKCKAVSGDISEGIHWEISDRISSTTSDEISWWIL